MRFAILSDIHGNLEALQAVLTQCAAAGVDRMVCLGDVVGYGADPNPCIAQMCELADAVLAGNHDRAAVGLEDLRFFNPAALAAVRWTETQLTGAHIGYLRARPMSHWEDRAFFVHASPYRPETWPYIFSPEEAAAGLRHTDAQRVFVGHAHRAFVFSEACNETVIAVEGTARLAPAARYLINAGSVGQPRDGDPRAAFAIWDRDVSQISLCRVPYDVPRAQAKILRANLPPWLAERLALGR